MLDAFIERWLGPLLIASGIAAAAYGAYVGLTLPDEPALMAEGRRIILGGPDPTTRPILFIVGGVSALSIGLSLVRYFRRERDAYSRSA